MCYKKTVGRRQRPATQRGSAPAESHQTHRVPARPDQSFAKFEEKRPTQSERVTVKSIFSKSSKKDKIETERGTSGKKGIHSLLVLTVGSSVLFIYRRK